MLFQASSPASNHSGHLDDVDLFEWPLDHYLPDANQLQGGGEDEGVPDGQQEGRQRLQDTDPGQD